MTFLAEPVIDAVEAGTDVTLVARWTIELLQCAFIAYLAWLIHRKATVAGPGGDRIQRLQTARERITHSALIIFTILSVLFFVFDREYKPEHIAVVSGTLGFVAGWISASFGFYFGATDSDST